MVCPSRRSASARSREVPGGHAEGLQEPRVAERDAAARDLAPHPLPRGHLEVRGFLQREPARPRAVDDRAGERVLAPALEAGRQAEELRLVVGRQGHDGRQPGAALRQRAGLVDDERVHLLEDLERLGVLDEDARRRAPAHAHHDRHRRREPERARARDDQDGHQREQRVGQPGLGPDRAPDERAQHGDPHDRRDEVGGHPVREALDGRAAPLGLGDLADDPGEQRVPADPIGAHHEGARAVDGAGGDLVPCPLLDGHRLARDHGFVDGAPPLEDGAVDGHPLAGPHAEPVAGTHPVERHVLLPAVGPENPRRRRGQPEQRPDGPAGPAPGAQLEHLAQQHQHRDHRRHLEVDADLARVTARGRREEPRRERGGHAVRIGGARAEPDQREHVRAPVREGRAGALEERPAAPQHHGGREHELEPGEGAGGDGVLEGLARDQVRHGHGHHGDGQRQPDPEPARHVPELGARLLLERDGPGLERHAADRAGAGLLPHDLRMHGAHPLGARGRGLDIDRLERHAARRTGARRRQPNLGVHGARVVAGPAGRGGGA